VTDAVTFWLAKPLAEFAMLSLVLAGIATIYAVIAVGAATARTAGHLGRKARRWLAANHEETTP
jgi:hypothetical protein